MSEILPVAEVPVEATRARSVGDAPLSERLPIFAAPEIHLDELCAALAKHGFHLRAAPEGWFLDQIHAIALVRKPHPEKA